MKNRRILKKQVAVALCVLGVAIGGLSLSRQYRSSASSQKKLVQVPEHVMFKHLFHHVITLKKKAEDTEKEGKDATQFKTHFIRKAQLSSEQSHVLEEVAAEFDQEEQLIAARAKPLVEAYTAQYPNGQVPHGQNPARPPGELRKLSEERDAAVLRARDRLHVRLGDEEFKRFDNFVKAQIAPNIEIH